MGHPAITDAKNSNHPSNMAPQDRQGYYMPEINVKLIIEVILS
jgi:hypothetical protein